MEDGKPNGQQNVKVADMLVVDRLDVARELAAGARVLDIGGALMPETGEEDAFAKRYRQIRKGAREYRVVDYQQKPGVDDVVDLNQEGSVEALREIVEEYRPEVVLAMEVLEHVNYHFETMNILARAVGEYGSTVWISLPNNGSWIVNAQKSWWYDHSVAFFRDIAWRFVTRSGLGEHEVLAGPCMGHHVRWWPLVYAAAFCQPMSWGFLVRSVGGGRKAGKGNEERLGKYTRQHFPPK